jgi:threonine-phosphate decarboxylase
MMMLERYGHGGDLLTAMELYGHHRDAFLDYSSNMNPAGPPAIVETMIVERWRDIVRYPDPSSRRLIQAISHHYQIPSDNILVGNGAAELLDLAVRVVQPSCTAVTAPSFVEYAQNALRAKSRLHHIPLREQQQFDLQIEDVQLALHEADLLMLGHPNNPTGRLIPNQVMQVLADANRALIIDEAFLDFLPNEAEYTQMYRALERKNWFVIRSMTKFFAIPGVRLGFVIAHAELITAMRNLQVHWSVNHFAQAIGEVVFADQDYINLTKDWAQAETSWLRTRLQALGFAVTDSKVNYLLAHIPDSWPFDVKSLQYSLGKKAILIRDASLFEGLNHRYFRLAVRNRTDNERLLTALQEIVKELCSF